MSSKQVVQDALLPMKRAHQRKVVKPRLHPAPVRHLLISAIRAVLRMPFELVISTRLSSVSTLQIQECDAVAPIVARVTVGYTLMATEPLNARFSVSILT